MIRPGNLPGNLQNPLIGSTPTFFLFESYFKPLHPRFSFSKVLVGLLINSGRTLTFRRASRIFEVILSLLFWSPSSWKFFFVRWSITARATFTAFVIQRLFCLFLDQKHRIGHFIMSVLKPTEIFTLKGFCWKVLFPLKGENRLLLLWGTCSDNNSSAPVWKTIYCFLCSICEIENASFQWLFSCFWSL